MPHKIFIELKADFGLGIACPFIDTLIKLYEHYSKNMDWNIGICRLNSRNGFDVSKIISIEGSKVYDFMKFEIGGHRLQVMKNNAVSIDIGIVKVSIINNDVEKCSPLLFKESYLNEFEIATPLNSLIRVYDYPNNCFRDRRYGPQFKLDDYLNGDIMNLPELLGKLSLVEV